MGRESVHMSRNHSDPNYSDESLRSLVAALPRWVITGNAPAPRHKEPAVTVRHSSLTSRHDLNPIIGVPVPGN
jgi:hypothetical protein